MSAADKYDPPKQSTKDLAHSAIRAAIGTVPVVGSAALEFFNNVLKPPVEKRVEEWMEAVAEGVRRLEERGVLTVEDLTKSEAFVTAAMRASEMAIRIHQREKIEALRNAVLNSALPGAPEDSLQQM